MNTNLYIPITKVEKTSDGHRIVTGVMTDEALDLDGQKTDYDWAKQAASKWFKGWANVREQHSSNAIGKGMDIQFDDTARAVTLTSKVIDPLACAKLDEQILQGYSWGAKGARVIKDREAPNGRIVDGEIVEVSLVDHPSNENCKIVIAKAAKNGSASLVKDVLADEITEDDLTKLADAIEVYADATEAPAPTPIGEFVANLAKTVANVEIDPDNVSEPDPFAEVKAAIADLEKKRVFYSRENRAAIDAALRNLSLLVAGDMQGGPAADTAPGGLDAVPPTGSTTIESNELNRDGDARVRQPTEVAQATSGNDPSHAIGDDDTATDYALRHTETAVSLSDVPTTARPLAVAQSGPSASVVDTTGGMAGISNGAGAAAQLAPKEADADLTKEVSPDLTKALTADTIKAIFPDLVKEFREALKDELKEEFASKAVEADVEKLAKGAQPGGPFVGKFSADQMKNARPADKSFTVNDTIDAEVVPVDVLEKMTRYRHLSEDNDQEIASSAKRSLKELKAKYFPE